jgi:hypothetical protein
MTMLRTGAIALVAVVAALVVEAQLDRPSQKEQNADLAQRVEELQQAQQELRDMSQRSRMQQARPELLIGAGQQQAAAPERTGAAEDEEMAEENGRQADVKPAITSEEIHANIENVFAADRDDPSWSGEARSRAQEGLTRTLGEGSSALSVRCRGSMCRIETRHHDMDAYRQFVDQALMQPTTALWNGGFFSSVVDTANDGQVTVVSFLARDGQALPVISRL